MKSITLNLLIALVLILFSGIGGFVGCNQNTVEPHEIAISLASVPSQVCIAINNERNGILEQNGNALHEQAVREEWTSEREAQAVLELHQQDDILRSIVSPRYNNADGELVEGRCRIVTEYLARVAVGVESFEDLQTDGWERAVSDLLALVNELFDVLRDLGIVDLADWLNERVQIGEAGLGDLLRDVLRFAEQVLERAE